MSDGELTDAEERPALETQRSEGAEAWERQQQQRDAADLSAV